MTRGRALSSVLSVAASAALMTGCGATFSLPGPTTGAVSPEQRQARAAAALQEEDFDLARRDLLALASDCSAGSHGRQALLTLAAAELDTGNPDRSPVLAAYLAERYLLLPDRVPEDVPLARTLYRLGTDLAGPVPPVTPELPYVAGRFDRCDGSEVAVSLYQLPPVPTPVSTRLAILHRELAARADSLALVEAELEVSRSQVATVEAEIAELEAEIERITELLKSGTPGHTRRERK